jgi:uncharacterized cysteine cluster protein YcgN (CxxCxxCC family)
VKSINQLTEERQVAVPLIYKGMTLEIAFLCDLCGLCVWRHFRPQHAERRAVTVLQHRGLRGHELQSVKSINQLTEERQVAVPLIYKGTTLEIAFLCDLCGLCVW